MTCWHPPLSTESDAAAARYTEGLHVYLSASPGSPRLFREALAADASFAPAAAALAVATIGASDTSVFKDALAAANAAAGGAPPMTRSHVAAVNAILTTPASRSFDVARKHLAAYPADALVLVLMLNVLHHSGRRNRNQLALGLLDAARATGCDHFSIPSLRSVIAADLGDLVGAQADAEAGLAANPRCAHAAHGMAHVFYETADHEAGRTWLDDWMVGFEGQGPVVHLAWHLALHDLALGDLDRLLERYKTVIRPKSSSASYTDAVDILWRARLKGASVREQFASLRTIVPAPTEVRGASLALMQSIVVLAGDGDIAGLRNAVSAVHAAKSTATWHAPLAAFSDALLALAEGDVSLAIDRLEPIDGALVAVGGSNAQLDLVTETLQWCYLRANATPKGSPFLITRLTRECDPRRPAPTARRTMRWWRQRPAITKSQLARG